MQFLSNVHIATQSEFLPLTHMHLREDRAKEGSQRKNGVGVAKVGVKSFRETTCFNNTCKLGGVFCPPDLATLIMAHTFKVLLVPWWCWDLNS